MNQNNNYLHEFKREKLIQFCFICQDSWPINDTAVSKYEICTLCGVTIHAGCRNFAKICYPCDNNLIHQRLTSQYLHDINRSGRVIASLVHAYDLGISPGTQLYGIFKVSTCQDILKTHIATMGEHDCVWDASHQSIFDSSGETPPSSPLNSNSNININNKMNNNVNINDNFKDNNQPNLPSNPGHELSSLRHIYHPRDNNRAVFAPPLLHLEIWKSFLGVFDSKIASCDTSLLPLLLHPCCTVERWFGLRNLEGQKAGMILLRLAFFPDENLISNSNTINAPLERPKVTLSIIDNSSDEDENRVKRSQSNVIEPNPSLVTTQQEKVKINMNEELKQFQEFKEESKVEEETRENDQYKVLLNHSSHNTIENYPNQPIEVIHIQSELLPPIINAENERLSIDDDHEQLNILPIILPQETNNNHNDIIPQANEINNNNNNNNNTNNSNGNDDNNATSKISKQEFQSDNSIVDRKNSITKDEKKIEATDITTESKLLNTNNTTQKWQEWWNTTTTELTKNVKERSTRAYDAISSITSSASIRKRKRKDGSGNLTSEVDKNCLNSGVGILHVELISAYKSFAQDAAEGDHFAVVNICTAGSLAVNEPLVDTDQERETHIIQSSSTPVFDVKYEFAVPHYRSAVKFTLVDAISEKKIGVATIHLYSIIQRDADKYQGKWELAEVEKIPMKDISGKNTIGYFTVRVRFQEDYQALFISSDPRKAAVGPPEAMSLDRVRIHIRRFGSFIEVIKVLFGRYRRLMDWENPVFTFVIFVLFVYFTLYLDAEYALCAPFFLLVALMTESWFYRHFGYFRKKWVATEDDSLNYPYRPVSYLRLAVAGFRNFGLAGVPKKPPAFVRITLLPEGEINNITTNTPIQEYHIATFSTIGDGNGVRIREAVDLNRNQQNSNGGGGLSQFISALNITKSDSTIKDALLQNVSDPWIRKPLNTDSTPTSTSNSSSQSRWRQNSSDQYSVDQIVDVSYLYPILQRICDNENDQIPNEDLNNNNNNNNNNSNSNNNTNNSNNTNTTSTSTNTNINTKQKQKKKKSNFIPWSKSSAMIKFTFYGDNPLGSFLDNAWGSVQIPIRDLVDKKGNDENNENIGVQQEVRLWKDIVWTSAYVQRLRSMETNDQYVENIGDLDNPYHAIFPREVTDRKQNPPTSAEVLLRLQLDVRQSPQSEPHPSEVEVSRVVQSLVIPKNEKSETTISAIWNARDHIKYVQNILASVIDNLESLKNIFNWTVPSKTFPIYAGLVAIWVATILIPGRYLILLVGFSEFFFIFFPQPEELPLSIKVQNLLKSLPNDDDLCEIYREEREINGAVFEERRRERLKQVKLRLVLDCLWDGAVNIKHSPNNGSATVWVPAFLVVQGHRLVWWATEDDVHEGNAPVGEIILQGHAGTTHASPVDIREMGNDHRLVVVFGRDSIGGQIKKTILCKDAESCTALKSVVNIILYGEDITS